MMLFGQIWFCLNNTANFSVPRDFAREHSAIVINAMSLNLACHLAAAFAAVLRLHHSSLKLGQFRSGPAPPSEFELCSPQSGIHEHSLAACLAAGNVAAAVAQALGTSRGSEKDEAAITKISDDEGAAWLKGDADALPPIFSWMSRSRIPQACSPWASSRSVYRYALR